MLLLQLQRKQNPRISIYYRTTFENTFTKDKKLLYFLKPPVSINIWYNNYLFNKRTRRGLLMYIKNRSRASSIDPRDINVPQSFIKIKSLLRHRGLSIYNIK